MAVRRLPTFNGYTVDDRLREFRKLSYGKRPEFIPFDSKQGRHLLKKLRAQGFTTPEEIIS
jgi:hypothetical protein